MLLATSACAQVEKQKENEEKTEPTNTKKAPHKYGGWYCPDNLNGFPPVNIKDWKNVPAISNRLPTKEETQNGTSLMYIDINEYPDAKTLNIELPKLATYFSEHTQKNEHVIIIQAISIQNDSVVGFRYLNGGNGSARLNDVTFLTNEEIEKITPSKFVFHKVKIDATQEEIWKIISKKEYLNDMQNTFIDNINQNSDWREKTNVNYYYAPADFFTSSYADKLFGCYYIQNDYGIDKNNYVEKFLLFENKEENYTELSIVCGPFQDDFEKEKRILEEWANQVKKLVEK